MEPKKRSRWRTIALGVLILLIVALVGARLYMPLYVKNYVNAELNAMPGYRGSVERIGIALYRGAYTIYGLKLYKIDKGIPVPFISIARTDISLQWGALLRGRIVSDIDLSQPQVNFAVSKSGQTSQTGAGAETNLLQLVDNLVPIDINYIAIHNGRISYQDFSAEPKVDIFVHQLEGAITNLRNVVDADQPLPSRVHFSGNSIGGGKLGIDGRVNILTRYIDGDLDLKLEGAALTAFNDFSNACCALKFKAGAMDVYAEMLLKEGAVSGYVKPIVRGLSVDRIPENSNPLEVLWAASASAVMEIFRNQSHDQFATRIPLSGHLDQGVGTAFWPTLTGILRNAFIEAFKRGLDPEAQTPKK